MRMSRPVGWLGTGVLLAGALSAAVPGAAADTAPNGLIAYSAWDDLDYDIYLVDPATPGMAPVRLTTDGDGNSNPDWSPDSNRIAYNSYHDAAGPRIRIMDTDPATDDSTIVSEPCSADEFCYGDMQPAWSPDGTRIAFVSARLNDDGEEQSDYELYVMDATGEVGSLPAATRLTTDAIDEETGFSPGDSNVTWSPDGTRIAFVSTGRGDDPDTCDLWTMDSRDQNRDGFGDHLERITFDDMNNCDSFEDVTPAWSPNSSLIAFTSTRAGFFDIWVVDADNPGDLRNVTWHVLSAADQPSWSPDGTQIIYRSAASGAYELYSLPVPPAAPLASAGNQADRASAPAPVQITSNGQPKQQADWGAVADALTGTVTLTVTDHRKGGVGTRDRNALRCGKDCTATFVAGSPVVLRAVPARGYRFQAWTGACSGQTDRCRIQLDESASVGAQFSALT